MEGEDKMCIRGYYHTCVNTTAPIIDTVTRMTQSRSDSNTNTLDDRTGRAIYK
jgi:hypothetical protein